MEWRKIDGHEAFSISDAGTVMRTSPKKGKPRPAGAKPPKPRTIPFIPSPCKLHMTNAGYLQVGIDRKGLSVHRLVAIAFLPNPLALPEVNHIDGIKTNNFASNLEWCTHQHNMHHALQTGLYTPRKGDSHSSSKLTEAQRESIRRDTRRNVSIAAEYMIDPSLVSKLKRGHP